MDFVIKFRIPIIIVSIVLSIGIGFFLSKVENDSSMEAILPKGHDDFKFYKEIENKYGGFTSIVVGVSHENSIYNKDTMNAVKELTDFFENLEYVDEDDVISLVSLENLYTEDGVLYAEELVSDRDDITESDIEYMKFQVNENPILKERIVSLDEKTTIVFAPVSYTVSINSEKQTKAVSLLNEKVAEISKAYPGTKFYATGELVSSAKTTEYMNKDFSRLFPFAILLVMVILYLILKELRGMIIPILVTIFSIVWTIGLKGLVGSKLTISESVIPVMLIAIGCADGVHIISEFYMYFKKGMSAKESIKKTMDALTTPVILTSITTSIGFASLLTAKAVSIRQMGIFLAFGVLIAMVLSLFFIPAILSFYGTKKIRPLEKAKKPAAGFRFINLDLFFEKWGSFVIKYKYIILILTLLFMLISIFGAINIKVESDMGKYFHKNDIVRKNLDHISGTMGGVYELFLVIEGNEENIIKEPVIQQAMWDIQKYAETFEEVSYSYSLTDYIRYMNYLLNDNDKDYLRLPNETETITVFRDGKEVKKEVAGKNQIANLLLLYEMGGGDTISTFVNNDYSEAKIHFRLKRTEYARIKKVIKHLKARAEADFPDTVKIRFSNYYLYLVNAKTIVDSQIVSIITSLIAIWLILSIIFRSPVNGLLTLIPTFIAIFFNFGVMWLFKIPLNIGTSTIAAIGLGVGVDYSIHFFSRFTRLFNKNGDYKESVVNAIKENGRGILSNALAVGLGFLVLVFSKFQIIFHMGWIISLSMLTTAVNSLVILPSIILLIKPKVKRIIFTKKPENK